MGWKATRSLVTFPKVEVCSRPSMGETGLKIILTQGWGCQTFAIIREKHHSGRRQPPPGCRAWQGELVPLCGNSLQSRARCPALMCAVNHADTVPANGGCRQECWVDLFLVQWHPSFLSAPLTSLYPAPWSWPAKISTVSGSLCLDFNFFPPILHSKLLVPFLQNPPREQELIWLINWC